MSSAKRLLKCLGAAVIMTVLACNFASAAPPRAIVLRGFFGVFSLGMDGLARELREQGVEVEVVQHWSWLWAVSEILQERAAGKVRPIVLVGHSQGANNIIDIA